MQLGILDVALALSGARSLQNGHESSHRATAGRRAEVGLDDPQVGGTTVGGVKRRTPSPGFVEQHSSEVSKLRRTNAQTLKTRVWPAQERDGEQRVSCCHSNAIPNAPWQRTRSSRRIPCGNWLTTSTTTAATQTSAPEALQQWCSIQHKILDGTLETRLQRTLDQIRDPSRQLPSRTPTAVLEQLRDRIQAIALDMSALNQSCNMDSNTPRAPGASQTRSRPSSPHVSPANADKAPGAEAAPQASETKEEI